MEQAVILTNGAGLHARPASLFAQAAQRFTATVTVRTQTRQGNAKSVLSLLALGAKKGDEVIISAEGPDAEEAVSTLVELTRNLHE